MGAGVRGHALGVCGVDRGRAPPSYEMLPLLQLEDTVDRQLSSAAAHTSCTIDYSPTAVEITIVNQRLEGVCR